MRLTNIEIENFCGARNVSLPIKEFVTLVCGPNGAGKSSIVDAVDLALAGSVRRFEDKGDYAALVSRGAKLGTVRVSYEIDGQEGSKYAEMPDGSTTTQGAVVPMGVEFMTNARRFADLGTDERRTTLYDLLGVQITPTNIAQMLRKRGCDAYFVEEVAPLAFDGFATACAYAHDRAKEARGVWKGITRETYGSKKADGWKPAQVAPFDENAHVALIEKAGRLDDDLAFKLQVLGALEERQRQQEAGHSLVCPHCGGCVALAGGGLIEHDGTPAPDLSAEISDQRQAIADARAHLAEANKGIDASEALRDAASKHAQIEEDAAKAHEAVCAWVQIADMLAPDGIPAELLAQAVKPFNDMLRTHAILAGWPIPRLNDAMLLQVDDLPYYVLSESEQWRVDALVTATIATLSHTRLMVLDRFDVLDGIGRSELLEWMEKARAHLDCVLLFGTLNKAPASEAGFMSVYRVENGVVSAV